MKDEYKELKELGSGIKTVSDIKDFLVCISEEDESIEDIQFSLRILIVAIERIKNEH